MLLGGAASAEWGALLALLLCFSSRHSVPVCVGFISVLLTSCWFSYKHLLDTCFTNLIILRFYEQLFQVKVGCRTVELDVISLGHALQHAASYLHLILQPSHSTRSPAGTSVLVPPRAGCERLLGRDQTLLDSAWGG